MRHPIAAVLGIALSSTSVSAQVLVAPATQIEQAAAAAALPANSEVLLGLNEELSSSRVKKGDTFGLRVLQDVTLGNQIFIPRGTRAVGEVTWKTGKAAFGKSGKMEVELRYLELADRRVAVDGKHRQEGEGNTTGAVVGVLAAGLLGGALMTGKDAVIPQGREIKAYTTEALALNVPAAPAAVAAAPAPAPAPTIAPAPAQADTIAAAPTPASAGRVAMTFVPVQPTAAPAPAAKAPGAALPATPAPVAAASARKLPVMASAAPAFVPARPAAPSRHERRFNESCSDYAERLAGSRRELKGMIREKCEQGN